MYWFHTCWLVKERRFQPLPLYNCKAAQRPRHVWTNICWKSRTQHDSPWTPASFRISWDMLPMLKRFRVVNPLFNQTNWCIKLHKYSIHMYSSYSCLYKYISCCWDSGCCTDLHRKKVYDTILIHYNPTFFITFFFTLFLLHSLQKTNISHYISLYIYISNICLFIYSFYWHKFRVELLPPKACAKELRQRSHGHQRPKCGSWRSKTSRCARCARCNV